MCMKSDKHGSPYFFLTGHSKDTVGHLTNLSSLLLARFHINLNRVSCRVAQQLTARSAVAFARTSFAQPGL